MYAYIIFSLLFYFFYFFFLLLFDYWLNEVEKLTLKRRYKRDRVAERQEAFPPLLSFCFYSQQNRVKSHAGW